MSDEHPHGFRWGNVWVTLLAHFAGKGRIVEVAAEDQENGSVTVYVSEGGRSIRVFRGDKELKEQA